MRIIVMIILALLILWNWRLARQVRRLKQDLKGETMNRRDRDEDLYRIVTGCRTKLGLLEPPSMYSPTEDWDKWRKHTA